MKASFTTLLWWYLGIYLVFFELNDLILDGPEKYFHSWGQLKSASLSLSSLVAFSLYSFGSYTVLHLLHRKSPMFSMVLVVGNVVFGVAFRYLIEEVVFPATLGFDNYNDNTSARFYLLDNLYYASIFTSVGCIYYFQALSRFKDRQRQAVLLENQAHQLAFLRSQVNPHFLFNTLNNIYALVHQKSDQALPAMDKLTGMLRYALYEKNERVPLEREWSYIEDFIQLQALRYAYPLQLQVEKGKDLDTVLIPPFLFIPLVENAFKHGVLDDPERPVKFSLRREAGELVFQAVNTAKAQEKDGAGGIGLVNIRQRLALMYGEEHRFRAEEVKGRFEVEVRIPLAVRLTGGQPESTNLRLRSELEEPGSMCR